MLAAKEWSKIGVEKKMRLQTTMPKGEQKATHFLQVPYKYSLSLMFIMVTLHYLVSSSLFVVNIVQYEWNQNRTLFDNSKINYVCQNDIFETWETEYETSASYHQTSDNDTETPGWVVNYSPLATIFTLAVSLILIAFPIILGFRRLPPGIPMVG